MSVQVSDIEPLVRSLIEDNRETVVDIFTFNTSEVFTLTESNVVQIDEVSVNDVSSGVTFVFDTDTNKLTITSLLTEGDTIEIHFTHFPDYSTTEIERFLEAALVHISTNNYREFLLVSGGDIWPEPNIHEKNLIAMITSLLIKPDNKTFRLPDITIVAPKDLPIHMKISKVIAIFKRARHGIFSLS